mmetsp:Transcript_2533/g.6843  ORF Transcript_2533/g.6843 Transcript_2533/m.6843 type:complete len:205 (+) Transcript_2533:1134-1748(+)
MGLGPEVGMPPSVLSMVNSRNPRSSSSSKRNGANETAFTSLTRRASSLSSSHAAVKRWVLFMLPESMTPFRPAANERAFQNLAVVSSKKDSRILLAISSKDRSNDDCSARDVKMYIIEPAAAAAASSRTIASTRSNRTAKSSVLTSAAGESEPSPFVELEWSFPPKVLGAPEYADAPLVDCTSNESTETLSSFFLLLFLLLRPA